MINDELHIKETDGIKVSACQVEDDNNLKAYYLCVENLSKQRLKLLGRDWKIADNNGNVINATSIGFNGELVELEAGEYFEMTETLALDSSLLSCYGNCKVMLGDEKKDIPIPAFVISSEDAFDNILAS